LTFGTDEDSTSSVSSSLIPPLQAVAAPARTGAWTLGAPSRFPLLGVPPLISSSSSSVPSVAPVARQAAPPSGCIVLALFSVGSSGSLAKVGQHVATEDAQCGINSIVFEPASGNVVCAFERGALGVFGVHASV
jgi:hypothetical protein